MVGNFQKEHGVIPDCYGAYDDKDLECINCEDREKCEIETNKIKEEDDDFI